MSRVPQRVFGTVDRRAVAVLGFSTGIVAALGPDAILLPLVEGFAPRAIGLTTLALLLAAGWDWIARRAVVSRGLIITLGLAALGGGLGTVRSVPWTHDFLRGALIDGAPWPGSLLISLTCGLALAPLALPLGALLGLAVAVDQRRSLALFALGGSAGLALAPHLGEIWLGRPGALQVAALCAVGAASLLAESSWLKVGRRLPRPALASLTFGSLITALCLYLAAPVIDLGAPLSTWCVAAVSLGAAVALLLPPGRSPPQPAAMWNGLALLGLPLLLKLSPLVSSAGSPGIAADLLTLLIVSLPLGFFMGRALGIAGAGPGLRGSLLIPAAVLPGAALLVLGLPVFGVTSLLSLSAVGLVLSCQAVAGRPALPRVVVGLALAAAFTQVPLPSAVAGLQTDTHRSTRHGTLSRFSDPLDGSPRLSIDGRAALGSSALTRRRLVHLPFLLKGQAERALLVASDLGQAVEAARMHRPGSLEWLRPVPAPSAPAWSTPRATIGAQVGPAANEAHGNERLHLARQQGSYDLIIHMPDPRGRLRAQLTGTREFFEENAAALHTNGLFCQWWNLADVDITDLKGIVGGALSAFEHTYVMIDHPRARHGMIGILGSHSPLRLRPSAIDQALALRPAVAADFDAVGLDGLMTSCLVVQHRGVLELLTPAERSVGDGRSILGVRGGLADLFQPQSTRLAMETFSERRCNPMHWISVPEQERDHTRDHVRDIQRGWQHLLGGAQSALGLLGEEAPPFDTEAAGQGPEVEAEGFIHALASLSDWPYLEQLVLDMAARLNHEGRPTDADHYLRQAIEAAPQRPTFRFALAQLVEQQGDLEDACVLYGTVLAFAPDHSGAQAGLERVCGQQ
ncbi:MAG: hypothetical protein ACI9EF_000748 [Pseudohongiellaceae bacterium]|jgi:hypothetical protein